MVGFFLLAWYCWCAVKSSRSENTSGKSSNTLGLKNQECAKAYPDEGLSVHSKCVFVIMPGFCTLHNVPQHLQSTETQHVCIRACTHTCVCVCVCGRKVEEVNPSGRLLRWDTVGAKGSLQREGRWEASPPPEP